MSPLRIQKLSAAFFFMLPQICIQRVSKKGLVEKILFK